MRRTLINCVSGMFYAAARGIKPAEGMPQGSAASRLLSLQRLTYLAKGETLLVHSRRRTYAAYNIERLTQPH